MKSFFFGDVGRQLFGAYHPASDDAPAQDVAVVLSYPGIHEYNLAHRAFRNLAGALARAGFPTLRFDYHATGDSTGMVRDGSFAQWVRDVVMAAREVQDLSGAREVSLVGRRLGAAIASTSASTLSVRDLILWDPVMFGSSYLQELDALDARQRMLRLYPNTPPAEELLGYPFPNSLRRELQQIDLTRLPFVQVRRLLVVATRDQPEYRQGVDALRSAGIKVALQVASEDLKRIKPTMKA